MENYVFFTLGVIFGLLQWNRRLLTDQARDHCYVVLEAFLRFALPDTMWTMVLNYMDFTMGVLPTTGVDVVVTGMTILDCTGLAEEFPAFGKA